LESLHPLLRVYEGCARALVGTIEGANIVKLRFLEPMVSYLSYPHFETDPHPVLTTSVLVHLQTFRLQYRHYSDSDNPPLLHRKEEFLRADDPSHAKYQRLTKQEEAKGLYEQPWLIGTRQGWNELLERKGLRFAGHRLLRA
jgi:DNA phosphorothioation-associated putative methyltransferase